MRLLRAVDERQVVHALPWFGGPYMPNAHSLCGLRMLPPVLHRAVDFEAGPDCCIGCIGGAEELRAEGGSVVSQLAIADVGAPAIARELRIVIPGEPVAQGRPKIGRWASNDGRSGVTARDPAKSRNWKAFAMDYFEQELERLGHPVPFARQGEPVELLVSAFFSCPKSDHRKLPRPERPKLGRPDYDNLAKIVGDAGNGVLWHDDAQIYDGRARKLIAAQGDRARLEISVRVLEVSR